MVLVCRIFPLYRYVVKKKIPARLLQRFLCIAHLLCLNFLSALFPGILQMVMFDRRIVYRLLTQTVLCICFGSGLFVRRLVQARAGSGPPGRWCFLVQTFIVGVVVFNWSWCTRMLCGCSERRSSCSACS